jgi:hypothetical protein
MFVGLFKVAISTDKLRIQVSIMSNSNKIVNGAVEMMYKEPVVERCNQIRYMTLYHIDPLLSVIAEGRGT